MAKPDLDLADLVNEAAALIEEAGDPERAGQMAAYMKNRFEFAGLAAKPRRDITRSAIKVARRTSGNELLDAAEWCFGHDLREVHYVGTDLCRAGASNLDAVHLGRVRGLIQTNSWWDTVDSLAAHTVGPLVARFVELGAAMDGWIDDSDLWVARTAILHQLTYKDQTDQGRLFEYSLRRADHRDFFIRKAIGWALRTYARVAPGAVAEFVETNRARFSTLTVREATKHL